LYLTLLLHDIGKAEGIRGHSESGVRLATPLLERFGRSEEQTSALQSHRDLHSFPTRRSSDLLYLTLLLHDIGKAEGIRGHSESGVRLATPLLERFGVKPADRDLRSEEHN